MSPSPHLGPEKPSLFSARRLALLASVAAVSTTIFFTAPWSAPSVNFSGPSSAHAQDLARPVSFADVVDRVKPAVFSVRVKIGGAPPQQPTQYNNDDDEDNGAPGTPLDRFFRRFGPEGNGPRGGQRDGQREGQRNQDGNGQRGPNIPRTPPRNFSMAQGSGFFISADGYAVTNNHVIDKARSVEITTDDGKVYTAKVLGADAKTDIALLKIEGRTDFPFVRFSETAPRVGDWVIAVGNPFGLGGTVTAGIVSARGRDIGAGPYDDFIQIDAPVNKGNSGGPTFDVNGNVIGVNTAIFSPSGGSVGIGFAIPADTAKSVIMQLKEHGVVSRGWLGVQIQPVTAEIAESIGLRTAEGALVAETQANSPALKAGIQTGDVITTVNGQPIKDARDLAKKVAAIAPGQSVKIGIVRGGAEQTVTLTLAEFPNDVQARGPGQRDVPAAPNDVPNLGLTLAPAGRNGGGEGVLVTAVDPDGPAAERGFKQGDLILDVGGKTVSSPSDVRKALADARTAGKKSVLIRVRSGQATRFVALPIGRA